MYELKQKISYYNYILHIIEVDIFKQEESEIKIKTDNSKSENWIIQEIFDDCNSHSICRKTCFRENELTDVNEESVRTQMKIPRGSYATMLGKLH